MTEQVPFETSLSKLTDIVEQLEKGDLSLEDMIALYEQGQALAEQCQSQLDQAELKITQLASPVQE